MKSFQNWLDFQHYSQHLKNLSNIKHRIPLYSVDNSYIIDNFNKVKFRSRTFNKSKQIGKSISVNQNFRKNLYHDTQQQINDNEPTYLLKKLQLQNMHTVSDNLQQVLEMKQIDNQTLKQYGNKNMFQYSDSTTLKKVNLFQIQEDNKLEKDQQKQFVLFRKTFSHNKQRPKFFNMSHQNNKTNKHLRSQTGNQKRRQRNKMDSNNLQNSSLKKRIIFNSSITDKTNIQSNNHSYFQVNKNIQQQLKVKNNRQAQLKKYLRFSQQKLLENIHSFLLQIKIINLSWMPNKQLLSFWIEAQTFRQTIKSSHYSFEQLKQKPIFLSFVQKPKSGIKIIIKYFRKLQQLILGEHFFIINKQTYFQENAVVQNKNNFFKAQMRISGKLVNKQKIHHRRLSSNLIKSKFYKKNFVR